MKQAFIERSFSAAINSTIDIINGILDEYERQRFKLSLRQLYYQMVARDYIPNTVQSYKRIGDIVSNARQAGLIDWDMIEDRGRETVTNSHWSSPESIIRSAAYSFRIDKWADQPYHIEVMVEKDALSGVLVPVCKELDIAITANKGYSSSSTMYEIGQRLNAKNLNNKQVTIIYLGDHDPSGIDMTRDVTDRLEMYSVGADLEVIRVALNMDQIDEWKPPENPAKQTDSRFASYAARFGQSSWELDAVEPKKLAQLVKGLVYDRRDDDLWYAAVERESEMRDDLNRFADTYRSEV